MITLGMFGSFIVGVVVCAIVVFFVWRNNKQKFIRALLGVNNIVNNYDTPEEIKDRIEVLIDQLKIKK